MRCAELREYLWDGQYRDTVGASVTANGQTHPYAVFRHRDRDALCVVVANYDAEHAASVRVGLDDGAAPTHVRLVEDSTWRPIAGETAIPPRSAAVFVAMPVD